MVPHPSSRTTARLRLCAVCVGTPDKRDGTMGRVTADGSRAQGSLNARRLAKRGRGPLPPFAVGAASGASNARVETRRANDTRPARGILRQGSIPHRIRFFRMRSTKMSSVKRRSVRKTHSLADQVTTRRHGAERNRRGKEDALSMRIGMRIRSVRPYGRGKEQPARPTLSPGPRVSVRRISVRRLDPG